MRRYFNITGACTPEEDYMADISGKLRQIRAMVDRRQYFTINRGRQYGKTTTLNALRRYLADEYICACISFEGIGDEPFETTGDFCQTFLRLIQNSLRFSSAADDAQYRESWLDTTVLTFEALSRHIAKLCEGKKVVLMIDEVDASSNYRIYIRFLGMLRDKFLQRKGGTDYTFHSVILAGVYDIKNIKMKMINAGTYTANPDEGTIYNSPWNIAAPFEVDMSFNPAEIAAMLASYQADYADEPFAASMDIPALSRELYDYTSGYPFLVSDICRLLDEKLERNWTLDGIREAIKLVLEEQNTLFDDMIKNLEQYPDLYQFIYELLIVGEKKINSIYDPVVNRALMFCFLKRLDNKQVVIHNPIFEMVISKYMVTKDALEGKEKRITGVLKQDVISGGRFDMELCLRKFAKHYRELFNESDLAFLERQGKMLFLSYLAPLLNGDGFYHLESQLSDLRRMDIVVDYGREQFIIELKIWRGETAHEAAYEQLAGYLRSKGAAQGYLLTFDVRKTQNREPKEAWVALDGGQMRIFDVAL